MSRGGNCGDGRCSCTMDYSGPTPVFTECARCLALEGDAPDYPNDDELAYWESDPDDAYDYMKEMSDYSVVSHCN
jgi:hypothetical protein